jgi:DNA primase
MDIVMSHQAGYANTVAVSGTGLTDDHLILLDRLSKNVVLAFDADAAGIASTGRAAALALRRGMDVKVAAIPHGKDPADCIKDDKAAWKEAVKHAVHVVDYLFSIAVRDHAASNGDERQLVLSVRDTVLPFVARIQSGVDQAHFIKRIAQALGIAEEAVRDDVRTLARTLTHDTHPTVRTSVPHLEETPEYRALRELSRREVCERALAAFLYWQESMEPRILSEDHVTAEAERYQLILPSLLARHSNERDALALQAEVTYEHASTTPPEDILHTLMVAVAREEKLDERERAFKELRLAEHLRDDTKARELLTHIHELSQCIDGLAR